MNKATKRRELEIVKVRLSSPFMARARCKHCGGSPNFYYYLRNSSMFKDPKTYQYLFYNRWKKGLARFNRSTPFFDPKYLNGASWLSHPMTWSKFRPRLARTRGTDPYFDIVEVVTCECMLTTWAFADKAIQNRPEINHRKSTRRFPFKFEF